MSSENESMHNVKAWVDLALAESRLEDLLKGVTTITTSSMCAMEALLLAFALLSAASTMTRVG